jgi:hypothetical protein
VYAFKESSFFVPAPVRTLIAASKAPMHCSDEALSSAYSLCSLLRSSVASFTASMV